MIRCNCKLILGLSDYENLATLHKAKKKTLLIATNLASICCVCKEKIVKDVSY